MGSAEAPSNAIGRWLIEGAEGDGSSVATVLSALLVAAASIAAADASLFLEGPRVAALALFATPLFASLGLLGLQIWVPLGLDRILCPAADRGPRQAHEVGSVGEADAERDSEDPGPLEDAEPLRGELGRELSGSGESLPSTDLAGERLQCRRPTATQSPPSPP